MAVAVGGTGVSVGITGVSVGVAVGDGTFVGTRVAVTATSGGRVNVAGAPGVAVAGGTTPVTVGDDRSSVAVGDGSASVVAVGVSVGVAGAAVGVGGADWNNPPVAAKSGCHSRTAIRSVASSQGPSLRIALASWRNLVVVPRLFIGRFI